MESNKNKKWSPPKNTQKVMKKEWRYEEDTSRQNSEEKKYKNNKLKTDHSSKKKNKTIIQIIGEIQRSATLCLSLIHI